MASVLVRRLGRSALALRSHAAAASYNALPALAAGSCAEASVASTPSRGVTSFSWSSVEASFSGDRPGTLHNLVNGEWFTSAHTQEVVDPLNGDVFLLVPDTQGDEIQPFVDSLKTCSKSGLHNPLKNPERYLLYGDISFRVAEAMRQPAVSEYFARLIQKVSPKSYTQAMQEVKVTRLFMENFTGDQVRFLARGFNVPGDHAGQQSVGYRWPFGPVAIIAPFNFPLEIPVLQLMGALYMGNKVLIKSDSKVSVVLEQFVRLLLECGLPRTDVDLIHCNGPAMNDILLKAQPRTTQFTGSSKIGEKLAGDLRGRIRLEDAGFDWKILGPDPHEVDYVAWQCDQDAYACSGQKCSAQSILFMHENWAKLGLESKLAALAARRRLDDLTIGPVLTVTTERMLSHVQSLLGIPGARLAFGGQPLKNHSIPKIYGAIEPTAVFVPIEEIVKAENLKLVTTEIFGPFQVLTEYTDEQLPLVLDVCENMEAHLTAAVVSNSAPFLQKVLSHTVNGTTYAGIRARTTGAPQNHWFGPAGDPRGAGIGTPEAIKLVWSCHREIIGDTGPVAEGWTTPPPT